MFKDLTSNSFSLFLNLFNISLLFFLIVVLIYILQFSSPGHFISISLFFKPTLCLLLHLLKFCFFYTFRLFYFFIIF